MERRNPDGTKTFIGYSYEPKPTDESPEGPMEVPDGSKLLEIDTKTVYVYIKKWITNEH